MLSPVMFYMLAVVPLVVSAAAGRTGIFIGTTRIDPGHKLRRVLGTVCIVGFFIGMLLFFLYGILMFVDVSQTLWRA